MEIIDYIHLLKKWIWLILLCMLFAGGTTYLISNQTVRIYRATATLLISQGNEFTSSLNSELLASERLARTYTERLASPPVLEQTRQQLGLSEQMMKQADISVIFVRDTQLIRIIVEHPSPEVAQLIANTLPNIFSSRDQLFQSARYADSKSNLEAQLASIQTEMTNPQATLETAREANVPDESVIVHLEEQLAQLRSTQALLLQSYEQVRLTEASHQDTIILDVPAELAEKPVKPQPLKTTLLAAMMGAMIALGCGFLVEYLDDTVKASTPFEYLFGIEPLALIGRFDAKPERTLVTSLGQGSPITESYRMLRTNIRFVSVDKPVQTLVVTSPGPREGKSTTIANLATVMAQAGQRVILVDADLRRPILHELFKVKNQQGLTNALLDREKRVEDYLQESSIEGLRLLPSGPVPPNPSELLGSQRMQELLSELQEQADMVLIDSPPVLVVSDTSLLATSGSGVLLVLRSNSTRIEAGQSALQQLNSVKAKIIGLVLNDVSDKQGRYYYYYSEYYSDESKESDESDSWGSSNSSQASQKIGLLPFGAKMRTLLFSVLPKRG